MTSLDHKLQRLARIDAEIRRREAEFGVLEPSRYHWVQPYIRRILCSGSWSAQIVQDAVVTVGRVALERVGEVWLHAPGFEAVELRIHGRVRLAYSVKDGEFYIHRYEPGAWEKWFGVDNAGDTIAIQPELFADDKHPLWRRFLKSGLSDYPPRFDPNNDKPDLMH